MKRSDFILPPCLKVSKRAVVFSEEYLRNEKAYLEQCVREVRETKDTIRKSMEKSLLDVHVYR